MRAANRLVPFLLVIAALMFARAPFMIHGAPVESTMGIIQKIFYYHVPSAMMAFLGAFVCGAASAVYLYGRNRFAVMSRSRPPNSRWCSAWSCW